jgi:uncharacterized protein
VKGECVHVKELWRYPVKSLAGERIGESVVTPLGFAGDRIILVQQHGKVITSRTHPRLLALKGTLDAAGVPNISGHRWASPQALRMVRAAAGPNADLLPYEGEARFDVLPLLVATDGAIDHMGFDGRRLRPNIVIGGVEGLAERAWPGRRLRIGEVVIEAAHLRGRCVMTTYDPDTQQQDPGILRRIVNELGGRMALDCSVISGGTIREGAPVELMPA